MKRKIACIFIIVALICIVIFPISVKAAWKGITIEKIDDAIEKAKEWPNNYSDLQTILYTLADTTLTTAAIAPDYETAQEYLEVTTYLFDFLKEDNLLRTGLGVSVGDTYWLTMESNIKKASEVKNPSKNEDDDLSEEPNDDSSGESSEKAWNEYSISDYSGEGEETIDNLWRIIQEVPIANLSTEEKVYYVQCLDALKKHSNLAEYNTGAEMNTKIPTLYEQIWEAYDEELKGTDAEKILNGGNPIYTNPLFGLSGQTAQEVTPNKIVEDADTFVQDGQNSDVATINQDNADTNSTENNETIQDDSEKKQL